MLKLYNASGTFVTMIPDTDYRDAAVTATLTDGDKQLEFVYCGDPRSIRNEYYIETDSDRYVVKEVHPADRATRYVCKLDLEDLEQTVFQQFTAANKTVTQAAALALVGTGWTVSTTMTKKRSVQTYKKTPLEILYKICDAFMCELKFDNVNKVVTFATKLGQDRGVYLRSDINLRSLSPTYDSYEYYTRLIPIGADGLQIDNDGKNYVENYTYSDKIRTLIWEDTSYTDAQQLKEDAIGKLSDLAAPKRSYSADIIDLARIPASDTRTDYEFLLFDLGDTIKITDEMMGVMEKQRIVKIVKYPDDPTKNTIELSNTVLTWEEMQARYRAAAQAWEDVSNADGSVNGVYVHGVKAGEVVGVVVDQGGTSTSTDLNSAVSVVQGQISVNASDIQAATARIGTIETTYLTATMANIDTANINKLKVAQMFAQVGLIDRAVISEGKITGYLDAVEVNAANITAGTLTTDRLVIRGTNKSIVYAINNISGAVQSQNVNTINGEIVTPRTITADRIVASSITANEITTENLVGTNGWINLRKGRFDFGSGRLAWDGSTMTISNWNVLTNRIEIDCTSQGKYRTGLQCLSDGTGAAFYAGCTTAAGGSIANKALTNFYVTQAGYLYAASAEISGTVHASGGDIAGWTIGTLRIYKTLNNLTTGMQAPSENTTWAFAAGATAVNNWSAAPFRVSHAGAVTCTKLTVNNDNFELNANHMRFGNWSTADDYVDITAGQISVYNDMFAGMTLTGSLLTVTDSFNSVKVGTTSVRLDPFSSMDAAGRLYINGGYFGLYFISQDAGVSSRWMIRVDGSGDVQLPSATSVSATMTFSAAPRTNNNVYYCSKNTDGTAVPLIGWSSGNNMWVGHYTFANRSNRINLGATIDNLYVYNSSGSTVLLSTQVSDRRLKHDITDLSGARDLIMGLQAKEFRYNGESENRKHYGFVAQDVRPLISDDSAILAYNPVDIETGQYDAGDESTFEYSMSYTELIAPIVKLLQEHDEIIRRMTT